MNPATGQPSNLKIKATASRNMTIASLRNNKQENISIASKPTTKKFDQNRLGGSRITIAGKASNNKDGISITGTSTTMVGRVTKNSQQNIKVAGTNRKKPRSLLGYQFNKMIKDNEAHDKRQQKESL